MMKITFDPEVDVLPTVFRDAPIEESDGKILGLEVLNASKQRINTRSIEFVITECSLPQSDYLTLSPIDR